MLLPLVVFSMLACAEKTETTQSENPARLENYIEILDERGHQIIDENATIEVLCEGFDWSEGPLWLPSEQKLIFSDVPRNTIYECVEGEAKIYLQPSGYTHNVERPGESGSNGLLLNPTGHLVLCQHGDRRMAVMEAPLSDPEPTFTTITASFDGQRFNSPNDAAFDEDGYLYFTDPPYGLPQGMNDSTKEITFQGVYRADPTGKTDLMTKELSRPNGIALSPDSKKIYVANSDPDRAIWMEYALSEAKEFEEGKVFFDATKLAGTVPGLPDGLKVNEEGILFATGPGGVFIFHPDGTVLAKIHVANATSNCALGENEKTLFVTADSQILSINLK